MKGKETTCALPYVDMFNHKNPVQLKWEFDLERNGVLMTSNENIPIGKQVFSNYGTDISNELMFMKFGFID